MGFAQTIEGICKHLDNAPCWPPDILRRHQFELLRPLVEHAYRTVPFYRSRFDELDVPSHQLADESLWRTLPLLTRFEIQDAAEALHSVAVPADQGRVSPKWTSGSTGQPVMVLRTDLTSRFWIANTLREYRSQACDLAAKVAMIRAVPHGQADPPDGRKQTTWNIATAGRVETGPGVVLDVHSTIAEQAEWLDREQPSYLQTYPSVVFELAKHFVERRRKLPSLRQVHTFGEVLEPKTRQACRQAWGVEILDSYSTNEVGHVAAQCAACTEYHIQAEHLLVEVIDERGSECGPGQIGRIVVTDLFNYAMPLLRYEIGDWAEVGNPCCCGSNLPTLRRVLGRQRNMLLLSSGEKHWPVLELASLQAFEGRLPVRQFQVIQRSLSDLEVKLVVARPLTPTEGAGIRELAVKWFGEGFAIRFSYVERIPRGPTGKFEDFRCEVPGQSNMASNFSHGNG